MRDSEVHDILFRARRLKFQIEAGDKAAAATVNKRASLAIGRHRHGTAGRKFAERVAKMAGNNPGERELTIAIRAQLLGEGVKNG